MEIEVTVGVRLPWESVRGSPSRAQNYLPRTYK